MSLVKAMDAQMAELRQHLKDLKAEARRAALQERAEVAGSTPLYATVAALPTGGLGMLATVIDDGTSNPALYWHDGSAWVKVSP